MNFHRIGTGLNVLPLQTALIRQPELFGRHGERQKTYVHGGMTDIWVRYNDIKNLGPKFNDEHDAVWYPEAAAIPQVRGPVMQLMAAVEGERLGGVLITKVPPGGEIKPHVDSGWHAGYYDKYYVPILNEPGAKFCFEDGEINPTVGDVWWFRNDVPHWVRNDSNTDRIAMIVCIKSHKGV